MGAAGPCMSCLFRFPNDVFEREAVGPKECQDGYLYTFDQLHDTREHPCLLSLGLPVKLSLSLLALVAAQLTGKLMNTTTS